VLPRSSSRASGPTDSPEWRTQLDRQLGAFAGGAAELSLHGGDVAPRRRLGGPSGDPRRRGGPEGEGPACAMHLLALQTYRPRQVVIRTSPTHSAATVCVGTTCSLPVNPRTTSRRCSREHTPARPTGLQVSEIGFGGGPIGGIRLGNSYGPTDGRLESQRAVRRACDLGCTFFDTADVVRHGHPKRCSARPLQGLRDKVNVATKSGVTSTTAISPADARPASRRPSAARWRRSSAEPRSTSRTNRELHGVLRALRGGRSWRGCRTDYIDLLQLHNPADQRISHMETYEVLEQLKREG